jgi:hypothetical protein
MRFPKGWARYRGDTAWNIMVLTLLTLLVGGLPAPAKSHEISTRDLRIAASSDGTAEPGQLLREIDDQSSGTRWLLVRDKSNPGGPGRLELASPGRDQGAFARQAQGLGVAPTRPVAIIRPGDKLLLEEHSPTADAYLEGVALGPAWPGSPLNVRLLIGHKVVRAVALAPGRAALVAATEVGR